MMPADELCPENFRDIRKAIVMQDPINVFPSLPAKLLIGFELLSLLVFDLQFVYPDSYTTNAGCIKAFIWQFVLEWVP